MVELIQVKSIERVAAAVKYAPHLVLAKEALGVGRRALLDLIPDGFEGILDKCPYFEGSRTHPLLMDFCVLDEFEEMRVFDFLAAVQQAHVLLHLFLEVEGEQTKLQLVAFLLATHPVLSWGDSPHDVELLGD